MAVFDMVASLSMTRRRRPNGSTPRREPGTVPGLPALLGEPNLRAGVFPVPRTESPVSLSATLLLGFLAGVTILLGLPVGRIRRPAASLRLFLNATAVGVLLFLVWDVLSAAWEPIDAALGSVHAGNGGLGTAIGYGLLFVAGLSIGLLSLVFYERWMGRVAARSAVPSTPLNFGPGAAHAAELSTPRAGISAWTPARRLALLIAVGIG